MGQVAIDLPDPLSNSPSAPSPGVDDLLAQLAGEEIDRLLAEAEIERPAPPADIVIPPGAIAVEHEPPLSVESHKPHIAVAPVAEDPAQAAPHSPQPESATPSTRLAEADVDDLDSRVAQELNSLFTELDADKPTPSAAVAAPAPAAQPATAHAPPVEAATVAAALPAAAPPMDPIAQAKALEGQLLGKALMDALGDPAEVEPEPRGLKRLNLSFLLRPLEWLNAPLLACSDTVRESLGKVAIMTLVNALAILLYVLFLRKH